LCLARETNKHEQQREKKKNQKSEPKKKWKRKNSNGAEDEFYQVRDFTLDVQDQISHYAQEEVLRA
jgi:hypothetical protein